MFFELTGKTAGQFPYGYWPAAQKRRYATESKKVIKEMEPPKSKIYQLKIPVMFCDIDGNGHVNNKHYNSYCDESMMRMFESSGIDIIEMANKGIGPVTYKAEYDYKGELKHGDTALIITTVQFLKKTRALFEHVIENAETGEIVCQARTYGIWINLETKKLHRFPDIILDKMFTG